MSWNRALISSLCVVALVAGCSAGGGGSSRGKRGSSGAATTPPGGSTSPPASGPAPVAIAPPVIVRIVPPEAAPGAQGELLGRDLDAGTGAGPAAIAVDVAGRAGTVLSAAPDRLLVLLPIDAETGPVRVTVATATHGPLESNAFILRVPGSRGRGAQLAGPPAAGNKGGLPTPEGPLAAKAREYVRILQRDHVPDGLVTDPIFDSTFTTITYYDDFGDAGIWTGTYIAAEAFRYAVTGDPDALANARRSLDALHTLQQITGVRGLYGRAFFRSSTQPIAANYGSEDHPVTAGPYAGHWWRGDVSRDQLTGILMGYAIAYDLIPDPPLRAQIASDVAAFADHLIANGYRIIDVDGQPTTHGDMTVGTYGIGLGISIPVPNPLHALLVASWFQTAYHVTGDARYLAEYGKLVHVYQLALILENTFFVDVYALTKFFNYNLAFEGILNLCRLETDPWLASKWDRILNERLYGLHLEWNGHRFTHPPREWWNPWYTFIQASQTRGHAPPDWLSVAEGIWSLQMLDDPPHRARPVDSSAFVTPDPFALLFGVEQAMEPVPVHLQPRSDFMWQRGPYSYKGWSNPQMQYPGIDLLAPYWMGRYYGLIPADM